MNKKGLVSVHTGLWFFAGMILGLGLAYYAAMQGWIPFGSVPKP